LAKLSELRESQSFPLDDNFCTTSQYLDAAFQIKYCGFNALLFGNWMLYPDPVFRV